jgi:hypothetical protein
MAPVTRHDLIGLPEGSPLWPWQPAMRYQIVDEGAFPEDDLARRDALLALVFRLEGSIDSVQALVLTDAAIAWFRQHPGFERVRSDFVNLLGAILAPLAPGIRVPEELLEVRNMLATRAEVWKQQWLQEGEQKGEATLLLRQLERRFGALPDWARDRIAIADTATLEEWGLRVLDAGSLEDVLV